jgi:hypothetical protein
MTPVKVISEEWEKKEKDGGDEPNCGSIYVYMETSQQNSLYNHILIKVIFLI